MLAFVLALALALAHGAPTDDNSRIIGGVDAPEGAYPYQVSLMLISDIHSCGGAIINSKTIVTAAHCIKGFRPEQFYILAGTNKLNAKGEKLEVAKLIPHEDFNNGDEFNDIGLVILKKAVKFTTLIKSIDLGEEVIGGNVKVTLTGWGQTNSGSPMNLQTINLKTISNDECDLLDDDGINNSDLCTLTQFGEGACFGDSGSPLTFNGTLVGVVSRGIPCAVGKPDVYARVSSYIEWIENNKA